MAVRINQNISAINAQRQLAINDQRLQKSLERLASGMRVNRAADGPANLIISEQMRAQIAGLNQAVDNSETAVSMIQTTEAALVEVTNLLTGMRQLAIHAANEGVNDENMLAVDQLELQNALDDMAVWQGGCTDYYRGPGGHIVTQWPHTMAVYRDRTREPDQDAYEVGFSSPSDPG